MISSLANAAVKRIVLLQTRDKARREAGVFIAEGVRMFMETPTDRLEDVYVTEGFLSEASHEVRERLSDTGYEVVTPDVFNKMSDTMTPQGVLITVRALEYTLSDILDRGQTYVLLDGLQDPGNLGTIFRSAEAFGAAGLIMSRDTVSIYNPKSVRSTMGTLYRMPFIYTDDMVRTITELRSRGVRTYAAALSRDGHIPSDCSFEGAVAFVIGNEGSGVSEAVISTVDECLFIPMHGEVESLNAAVAASVILYEADRQKNH